MSSMVTILSGIPQTTNVLCVVVSHRPLPLRPLVVRSHRIALFCGRVVPFPIFQLSYCTNICVTFCRPFLLSRRALVSPLIAVTSCHCVALFCNTSAQWHDNAMALNEKIGDGTARWQKKGEATADMTPKGKMTLQRQRHLSSMEFHKIH